MGLQPAKPRQSLPQDRQGRRPSGRHGVGEGRGSMNVQTRVYNNISDSTLLRKRWGHCELSCLNMDTYDAGTAILFMQWTVQEHV